MGRETDEEGNPLTRLVTSGNLSEWLRMARDNPVVKEIRVSGGLELEHEDGQLWWCPDYRVDDIRHVLPKGSRGRSL
jgi:hypothetical protein